MPDNVCFGCGTQNPEGLQIRSYMEGGLCVAIWHSQEKYHGWENVLNGGVLATLIDCHSMAAALQAAYAAEDRSIGSQPVYRYATGSITVRYLKPTPNDRPIRLEAGVESLSGRKARVSCEVKVDGVVTTEAEVVAIRVFESKPVQDDLFQ